jgi:hypothetical protein
MEQKGKGAANAVVTSWLEPGQDVTLVKMIADIQLTGAVAQLSRGLLPEVSRKLTAQFADCLHESMVAGERAASLPPAEAGEAAPGGTPVAVPAPVRAKPISGIRLGISAAWSAVVNLFRRLLGRERP